MPDSLTVAAASSLADVFPLIGAAFTRQTKGQTVPRFSFAASGTIARQIMAGAPIDVFAAVGEKEMTDLGKAGAILAETRVVFAANRLVLIQSQRSRLHLHDWRDLAKLPPNTRIVIGNPDTVPAGRFARDVLMKRGLWDMLQSKRQLVLLGSVRQALDAAVAGNADVAIVFATDARAAGSRVRLVAVATPGSDYAPIRYSAVITKAATNPDVARAFLQSLTGPEARKILGAAGFAAP